MPINSKDTVIYFSAMFGLGTHTLQVPMTLHQTNRKRLCKSLHDCGMVEPKSVVLLQGGDACQRYCTDVDNATFRQVRNQSLCV